MTTGEKKSGNARSPRSYLGVVAGLLIAAGVMHVLFSVLGLWSLASLPDLRSAITDGWVPFLALGDAFAFQVHGLIAVYLIFQVSTSWLVGILSLAAAWSAIRKRARAYFRVVSAINLIYFPAGTTIGVLLLLGLSRPPVARLFGDSEADDGSGDQTGDHQR